MQHNTKSVPKMISLARQNHYRLYCLHGLAKARQHFRSLNWLNLHKLALVASGLKSRPIPSLAINVSSLKPIFYVLHEPKNSLGDTPEILGPMSACQAPILDFHATSEMAIREDAQLR